MVKPPHGATRGARLRRLLIWACAFSGIVAIAWIVGDRWISAREPGLGAAIPDGVRGRLLEAGGRSVRGVDEGAGPAVLLVAGTGGSAANWPDAVVKRLAERHRVILVDLLGMGFSERSADLPYGFALWSQQLASVLESLLAQSPAEVVYGARIVEVRQQGVDKGQTYMTVLDRRGPFDLVIAAGDDRTDEDLFARLGDHGFSVHVGSGSTRAKASVASPAEMRALLAALAEKKGGVSALAPL